MTLEPVPDPDIRDWQLERYQLGELPAGEARTVQEALARDEAVRVRLSSLEESNAEVLRRYPPSLAAAAVLAANLQGSATTSRLKPPHAWLAAAAAVVVLGAGVVALAPKAFRPSAPTDITRVKGVTPYLLVYRMATAEQVERLQPGSLAHDHDQVQLAYQAAGRRYGVIVSVDGRGVMTRHLPVTGATAVLLKPGPPVPLLESYELDDAPGFERFYFITADEPFSVERVLTAVRQRHESSDAAEAPGHGLDLPRSMDQFTFTLEKEAAP
jgi:hypothetical protein